MEPVQRVEGKMRPSPRDIRRIDVRKFVILLVLAIIMICLIVAQTLLNM
jgi:hypothetical protein